MISTHVLDTGRGAPAAQVDVVLEKKTGASWSKVSQAETDSDGRIAFKEPLTVGFYRLNFSVESYFARSATATFYDTIPIVFKIDDVNRKYHVPLLLNPFGYSTYRGS